MTSRLIYRFFLLIAFFVFKIKWSNHLIFRIVVNWTDHIIPYLGLVANQSAQIDSDTKSRAPTAIQYPSGCNYWPTNDWHTAPPNSRKPARRRTRRSDSFAPRRPSRGCGRPSAGLQCRVRGYPCRPVGWREDTAVPASANSQRWSRNGTFQAPFLSQCSDPVMQGFI
jgi:hypothetical protein